MPGKKGQPEAVKKIQGKAEKTVIKALALGGVLTDELHVRIKGAVDVIVQGDDKTAPSRPETGSLGIAVMPDLQAVIGEDLDFQRRAGNDPHFVLRPGGTDNAAGQRPSNQENYP